jgi:fatty acid kinase fatty acid binding subunit
VSVAVVTDSTAYLSDELIEGYGIHVVPLYVVLAGHSGREGWDIGPGDVARALGVRGQTVSTSRPTPGDFVAAYRRALAAGADRLVSIHLSSELSGTWDAARLAASQVGEHIVTVVDSRSAAMGAGFAVLAAARSAAAAVLGSALAVKPVLHVQDGRVVPLEKVRTSARALNRLVQRAVEAAGQGPVSVAVHHLAAPERAERLAAELRDRLPQLRELHVSELGAAIGAHVGPGAVGIVVAPFWQEPDEETYSDTAED